MDIHISSQARVELSLDKEKNIYSISFKDNDKHIVIHLSEEQINTLVDLKFNLVNENANDKILFKLMLEHSTSQITDKYQERIIDLMKEFRTLTKRVAEVEIYIPDKHVQLIDSEKITNACGEFMEALGYELETEDEPIYHSFWQKLKFVLAKQVTPEEIDNIMKKGKRALELKHVELPTAEQTEKLANAAAKIIESLENYDEGVARLGALLVLKKKIDGIPKIIIQQLNQDLIKMFENDSELIKNIQKVYELVTSNADTNIKVLIPPQQAIDAVSQSE